MPRTFSPPKYRHYKPRNLAVVRIAGKDHYLGPYGSPESRERYARLIADRSDQFPAAPRVDLSVTELIARYWEWASGYYVKNGRPTGQLPKLQQSMRILRELYGSTMAIKFGPVALRAVQKHCVQSGRCRNYVNAICAEIRRLYKWAASHEFLPASVYEGLKTVPGLQRGRSSARETDPVRPVSDAVVDATLPFLPAVVADLVRFQRLVGCRPSEACSIRPCDVNCAGEVWEYVPAEHKTEHHGRERRIFIGPRAKRVLLPYLLRPSDSYCFSPIDSESNRIAELRENRKSKVPLSQIDRSKTSPKRKPKGRYTKDSYNRAVARAVAKVNAARAKQTEDALGRTPTTEELKDVLLKKWSPNQLRHAVATDIRSRFGIDLAGTVLGHANLQTTAVYAERDFARAAEIMRQIG